MTGLASTDPDAAGRSWPAPARINLRPRILGRRADGCPLLQRPYQLLDFDDELRFAPRSDGGPRLSGNSPAADSPALRVAKALLRQSADIHIDKNIPLLSDWRLPRALTERRDLY